MTPRVELIAQTEFRVPDSMWGRYGIVDDAPSAWGWAARSATQGSGVALVEFAGRACYQSWDRPNPRTATQAGYVANLLAQGHLSVLEHASYTVLISCISRSETHEHIRHRHLSYSQLSQRYVDSGSADHVLPLGAREDEEAQRIHQEAQDAALSAYAALVEVYEARLAGDGTLTPLQRRKRARQWARYVLPNQTETQVVVTGNLRAWRHFVAMRATEHADDEIREVALAVFRLLREAAPAAWQDCAVETVGHVEVVRMRHVEEG